jgi:VWFA-related protein
MLGATLAASATFANSDRAVELQRKLNAGHPLSDAELDELMALGPSESVSVDRIMVPVTVTSRWGRPIGGLKRQDFKLEVGGRPLKIDYFSSDHGLPLRLAVLLDVSGSMGQTEQRTRVRDALTRVLPHLKRDDEMQLMTFASAEVRTQRDWTSEVTDLVALAINIPAAGETAIIDALREAARLMPEPERSRPAILLVTDGIDNASQGMIDEAIETARAVGVPVYALGIGGLDRHVQDRQEGKSPYDALRVLAEQTGGAFFEISDTESATEATAQITQELRHQYWLAFRPYAPPDGRFRPIRVSVDRSGARVRARTGYK